MADLVQTAASVILDPTYNNITVPGAVAGEAILAGASCYQSNTNSSWYNSSANNALASGYQNGLCIALASAPGAGQPLTLLRSGRLNIGATLTAGKTYVASQNAGKIAPLSDLTSTMFTSILGIAVNTTYLVTPQQAGTFVGNAAIA